MGVRRRGRRWWRRFSARWNTELKMVGIIAFGLLVLATIWALVYYTVLV